MAKKQRPLQIQSDTPTWVMLLAVLAALRTVQLGRFSMETVARRLRSASRKKHLQEFASLNYRLFERGLRRHRVDGTIPMPVLSAMLTAMKEEGGTDWTPERVWGLLGSEDEREQHRFVNIVCRILRHARTIAHKQIQHRGKRRG